MIKKDEEKKRKEEKDKLKKQQKEERKQIYLKEKAQKDKEEAEKAENHKSIPILCLVKMMKRMKWKMILWISQSHPPVITSQKAHCHDYH